MPQDTPSRKLDQYIVRFPAGMRGQIAAEAKKNGRSMNAEIVARLQASLDADVNQTNLNSKRDRLKEALQHQEERLREQYDLIMKSFFDRVSGEMLQHLKAEMKLRIGAEAEKATEPTDT